MLNDADQTDCDCLIHTWQKMRKKVNIPEWVDTNWFRHEMEGHKDEMD